MTVYSRLPVIPVSIGLVFFLEFSALIVREFIRANMGESGVDPASAKHMSAIGGLIFFGILMSPLFNRLKRPLTQLLRAPTSWTRLLVSSMAIALAFKGMILSTKIARFWLTGIEPEPLGESYGISAMWACSTGSSLWIGLLVMVLMTPVVEEIINRGLFLCALLRQNRMIAVFVSAALFAVFHVLENMVFAFMFGIVSAILVLQSGSLWGAIVAHSFYNVLDVIDGECVRITRIFLPEYSSVGITGPALLFLFAALLFASSLLIARKTGVGTMRPDTAIG